ncbi:MAG: hypothetical protein EWM73_03377 [Nitrospira sp.]|nr:MAG: hypothetical protein EWM73_03377 [Nitrospira sp.]
MIHGNDIWRVPHIVGVRCWEYRRVEDESRF